MSHILFVRAMPVIFIACILPLSADATVTITTRAPIESLGADGSISGVSMATVGAHYSLVKYTAIGVNGAPMVVIADSQNHQYRIGLSATDYKPSSSATLNSASISTENSPGTLSLVDLPPIVQKTVQSHLEGKTVGDIERNDEGGEISYDIETIAPQGEKLGMTIAQDGTLLGVETTLADVPAVLQTAINNVVGHGKLNGIEKNFDESDVTYTAGVTTNGQEHDFTFAENGILEHQEVDMADLPAAVQTAIRTAIGPARLEGIEKKFDDSQITYTADTIANGQEHDFTFQSDGTLSDMEIDLTDLPSAIQTAINAISGQGKLEGIDKAIEDGETTYTATYAVNGQEHSFTFDEDGTLSSEEVPLSELPPGLQTTIKNALGVDKLEGIDKTVEDGVTTYAASITTDGQEHDLTFGEDGTLLSREVKLTETPANVQATIASTLGNGKVTEIDLSFENGKRHYEVEGQKDGQDINFTVGPKGKFLGMDN